VTVCQKRNPVYDFDCCVMVMVVCLHLFMCIRTITIERNDFDLDI